MSARGVVVGLLVGVVVVGAGAVGADRWAAHETQQRAADAIVENLDDVVGTPTVDVGGFPFLTQVWAGSVDHVTGDVEGVSLGGIDATDVHVDARDITTSEPYTAGTATIEATIPTASLEKIVDDRTGLDVTLTIDGDQVVASGTVLGVTLSAGVTPAVSDGMLQVSVHDVLLGGLSVDPSKLPGGLGDKLRDITVPVEGLPDGIVLTDATVVSDGLRVEADGAGVVLQAPTPSDAPTG